MEQVRPSVLEGTQSPVSLQMPALVGLAHRSFEFVGSGPSITHGLPPM